MKIKFVIRRAVLGVVIVPAVAGIYFVGYAVLIGAGAGANAMPSEVWNNGLALGVGVTLALMFWETIDRVLGITERKGE
jgi:hypothetical protein